MAYYTQERKAKIAPKIKAILSSYGVKGSLSVRNNSTVVLTLRSGKIDFMANYHECVDEQQRDEVRVNQYYYKKHFSGVAQHCLGDLLAVLNDGNHDRSDVQSDYFDVGWYIDLNIGEWGSPYKAL